QPSDAVHLRARQPTVKDMNATVPPRMPIDKTYDERAHCERQIRRHPEDKAALAVIHRVASQISSPAEPLAGRSSRQPRCRPLIEAGVYRSVASNWAHLLPFIASLRTPAKDGDHPHATSTSTPDLRNRHTFVASAPRIPTIRPRAPLGLRAVQAVKHCRWSSQC